MLLCSVPLVYLREVKDSAKRMFLGVPAKTEVHGAPSYVSELVYHVLLSVVQ
jgi:hypothetical protein